MEARRQKLGVVVPVYNEAGNMSALHQRIAAVFDGPLADLDWCLLLVDDGSSDHSWDAIRSLTEAYPEHVTGLCLSRNFGKEMALTAGVEAIGEVDAVICLDADLQHPPEEIPTFVEHWRSGSEIVVGIRETVADYSLVKRLGSMAFYWIMRRCSDVDIPPNSTDFRLLDKKVLAQLCRLQERTRMFRGLIDWLGFRKSYVTFKAPARLDGGRPSYSLRKLSTLAVNSITSFSLLPLRVTGYLGLLVCGLSTLLLLYMVVTDFFDLSLYTARAYIIVILTDLMGVVLCALGMIALYIGHIHTEVVGRPLYIIRDRSGSEQGHDGCDRS